MYTVHCTVDEGMRVCSIPYTPEEYILHIYEEFTLYSGTHTKLDFLNCHNSFDFLNHNLSGQVVFLFYNFMGLTVVIGLAWVELG